MSKTEPSSTVEDQSAAQTVEAAVVMDAMTFGPLAWTDDQRTTINSTVGDLNHAYVACKGFEGQYPFFGEIATYLYGLKEGLSEIVAPDFAGPVDVAAWIREHMQTLPTDSTSPTTDYHSQD